MPSVGSEHLTAAKTYGIGKGAFQEGVQGAGIVQGEQWSALLTCGTP